MSTKRLQQKNVIYFLPNLLTTGNLFCGFYSIIASLQDLYIPAATAILTAGIFDVLDGRIARMTKVYSRFGEEYDSLSDLVSFGLAPSILLYLWSLESFGRIGWLICFVFVGCGTLRLARFNVKITTSEKSFFEGLSIPMAAFLLSTTVFLFHELMLDEKLNYFILAETMILSFLMVSKIKYHSFKEFNFKNQRSFRLLVFAIFIFMIIAYNPGVMMFVAMISYVTSGPLFHMIHRFNEKKKKTEEGLRPNLRLIEEK